jgi:hypothetical protein
MTPKFEIRTRTYRDRTYPELYRDGEEFEFGEGPAEVETRTCEFHGKAPHISGYNQGGHDGMSICLLCCQEILNSDLET